MHQQIDNNTVYCKVLSPEVVLVGCCQMTTSYYHGLERKQLEWKSYLVDACKLQ